MDHQIISCRVHLKFFNLRNTSDNQQDTVRIPTGWFLYCLGFRTPRKHKVFQPVAYCAYPYWLVPVLLWYPEPPGTIGVSDPDFCNTTTIHGEIGSSTYTRGNNAPCIPRNPVLSPLIAIRWFWPGRNSVFHRFIILEIQTTLENYPLIWRTGYTSD